METNEMQRMLNAGIGTKEAEALSAKQVTVEDVLIRDVTVNGKLSKKVVLICKHPDREATIELSQAGIRKGDKFAIQGLWLVLEKKNSLDEPDQIVKNSNLSEVMRFYRVNTILQFKGKTLLTEKDKNGFLSIKAY